MLTFFYVDYSYEMIADGEEHTVELLAVKKNFTMRVDGGRARSIINDGDKDSLKLTTPLFIGGLPPTTAASALNLWHLRNSTSFHGKWKKEYNRKGMMGESHCVPPEHSSPS